MRYVWSWLHTSFTRIIRLMRLILHAFGSVSLAVILLVGTLVCVLPAEIARADEFLGVEIEAKNKTYIVTRDVNVRAKPDTKSKRIAGLKKGQRVSVAGRHQGWLAIRKDGEPFGFAYFKYLIPLIEGVLDEPVRGKAKIDGDGLCAYEIAYVGESSTESTEFAMADYDVSVRCDRDGKRLEFVLFMFMTEGAYKPSRPEVHQIGIDLLEIDTMTEYDEIFSTNVFFNSGKSRVVFDSVTIKAYAGEPETKEQEADTVPEALDIAVNMTLESWNQKAWQDLSAVLNGEAP